MVMLSWSPPETNTQTSYLIQVSTDGQNYTVARVVEGTMTTANIGDLNRQTIYYFRISAINSSGGSPWSEFVTATIP